MNGDDYRRMPHVSCIDVFSSLSVRCCFDRFTKKNLDGFVRKQPFLKHHARSIFQSSIKYLPPGLFEATGTDTYFDDANGIRRFKMQLQAKTALWGLENQREGRRSVMVNMLMGPYRWLLLLSYGCAVYH